MSSDTRARPTATPDRAQMQRSIVEYYDRQLECFGASARGMDWKDERSQHLRFEILSGVCALENRSVGDVGCGAGHFHEFLVHQRTDVEYHGFDASQRMIDCARSRNPTLHFECRDILVDPPERTYDVVLCSGLFHVKLDYPSDAWHSFVEQMIRRMYDMCDTALAFNLISDQVDYRSPRLFYSSPADMLQFCRRELSRFVVLRHDYPLYEYTVYVYRDVHPD